MIDILKVRQQHIFRIRNNRTHKWWEGLAFDAHDACDCAGWLIDGCYVRVFSDVGAGGWKKPEEKAT